MHTANEDVASDDFSMTDAIPSDKLTGHGDSYPITNCYTKDGAEYDSARPVHYLDNDYHIDSIDSFLGIVQLHDIDLVPATWQPAPKPIGSGRTGDIRESLANLQLTFAFKRIRRDLVDEKEAYSLLTAEILVLGHPSIRSHPNVLHLQGVCWDVSADSTALPVLLFEKAKHGDLDKFACSGLGKAVSTENRLKLCAEVAYAIDTLHTCSLYRQL
jgi:hypothetical protein